VSAVPFTPWHDLLASMEKRRSYDARFYKPVCLIAVIDGVLDGTINPEAIDPKVVINRFRSYVRESQPDRADLGWRPFWHLANDGAWVFTKDARPVKPSDFGRARKPDSPGQLFSRIDAVRVPLAMERLWKSDVDLEHLRQAVLAILERDDETCQSMAAVLRRGDAAVLLEGNPAGFEASPSRRGQGFQASAVARVAVEVRAMVIAQELLSKDGWVVEDVSSTSCFDLIGRRSERKIYVEVKGSTGTGEQIILTRAEVDFALKNREAMMLIVVSDIQLSGSSGNRMVASGGRATIYRRWSPQQDLLQPISYTYVLRKKDAGAQN
jgi:hypothetical protein